MWTVSAPLITHDGFGPILESRRKPRPKILKILSSASGWASALRVFKRCHHCGFHVLFCRTIRGWFQRRQVTGMFLQTTRQSATVQQSTRRADAQPLAFTATYQGSGLVLWGGACRNGDPHVFTPDVVAVDRQSRSVLADSS